MKKSESIKNLAIALCKVQEEMGLVPKDSDNPYFKSKYAGMASVVQLAMPILTKNGLAISQICGESEGDIPTVVVETVLMHESGEWISGRLKMFAVKKVSGGGEQPTGDPQAFGSCITYARRYAFMAIIGLVADEDDDGNKATWNKGEKITHTKQDYPDVPDDPFEGLLDPPKNVSKPTSTDRETYTRRIHANLNALGVSDEYKKFFYRKHYGCDSSTDLPDEKMKQLSNHVFFLRTAVENLKSKGYDGDRTKEWFDVNFGVEHYLGLDFGKAKQALDQSKTETKYEG
jgi:hypothetical protein